MTYVTPADVDVSDNWQDHKNRNSAEPGTDYKTIYDTNCRMPGDGTISTVDNNNGGPEGRRLSINMDNGHVIDMIHGKWINAFSGMRITKGQQNVFYSGASGYGDDWYYDPHLHVTLREKAGLPYTNTINFEDWIDIPEPPQQEGPFMPYSIVPVENGVIYLVSLITGKRVHILQPRDVELLIRVKNNNNTDHMLTIELDIVDAYLNELHKLQL